MYYTSFAFHYPKILLSLPFLSSGKEHYILKYFTSQHFKGKVNMLPTDKKIETLIFKSIISFNTHSSSFIYQNA